MAVTKHHGQKQAGEERLYLAYISTALFIMTEVRTGGQGGRNLEADAMEGAAYMLRMACPACFLTESRDGTTHHELGPPTSITN